MPLKLLLAKSKYMRKLATNMFADFSQQWHESARLCADKDWPTCCGTEGLTWETKKADRCGPNTAPSLNPPTLPGCVSCVIGCMGPQDEFQKLGFGRLGMPSFDLRYLGVLRTGLPAVQQYLL